MKTLTILHDSGNSVIVSLSRSKIIFFWKKVFWFSPKLFSIRLKRWLARRSDNAPIGVDKLDKHGLFIELFFITPLSFWYSSDFVPLVYQKDIYRPIDGANDKPGSTNRVINLNGPKIPTMAHSLWEMCKRVSWKWLAVLKWTLMVFVPCPFKDWTV